MSHKEPDSHINVTVEFGEGEGQISLKEVEKRAEARKPKEVHCRSEKKFGLADV